MMTLTPKQRQYLRGLAHPLKPLVHIGKEGVTRTALTTIEEAFNTREVLKVKVLQSAPDSAPASGEAIVRELAGVHLVQVIGRTVVFYRVHPERPEIRLP